LASKKCCFVDGVTCCPFDLPAHRFGRGVNRHVLLYRVLLHLDDDLRFLLGLRRSEPGFPGRDPLPHLISSPNEVAVFFRLTGGAREDEDGEGRLGALLGEDARRDR